MDQQQERQRGALGALILAGVLAAAAGAALAHEPPAPRAVSVSGEGEVRVKPDRARLTLGADAVTLDLKAAETQVNRVVRDYLAEAKKLGAKDAQITTTGVSIQPEYIWDEKDRRQVLTGYRVHREIVVVVTDLEQLGEFVLRATRAGVNHVQPPALEHSRARELSQDALELAAKDARERARRLAATLDAKLGPALRIDAAPRLPPPIVYKAMRMQAAEGADAGADMAVSLGEIVIGATVTAEFELLQP